MKQFAKVLASFSLAATMCLGVGFAADSPHPGEHGTVDKAMVSEETDKAYDEKPNIRRFIANSPGIRKYQSYLRSCQFHSS